MDILSQNIHSVSERGSAPSFIKEGETAMGYHLHNVLLPQKSPTLNLYAYS